MSYSKENPNVQINTKMKVLVEEADGWTTPDVSRERSTYRKMCEIYELWGVIT